MRWTATVLVFLAATAAHAGSALTFRADGAFDAPESGIAHGEFAFTSRVRGDGRARDRVRCDVADLDATRDADGRLPRLSAVLVAPGGAETPLGTLRVSARGRARLARRVASAALALRDAGGAALELRDASGTLLRATLPAFALDGADAWSRTREVYGRFVVPGLPSVPRGSVLLRTTESSDAGVHSVLALRASSLVTGPTPSAYRALAFDATGGRVVELGALDPEPDVGANLTLDSQRRALPGGIVRWTEFSGGRIEVRVGSSVRLRAAIAPLRGVDEPQESVGHAHASASRALTPVAGPGRGLVRLDVDALPRGHRERFELRLLDTGARTLHVTARAASGTTTTLGDVVTKGAAGAGALVLDTRRGARFPGAPLVRLAGQTLDVRTSDGTLVFTTTLPALE